MYDFQKLDYQKSSKRPRRNRPNYNGKHEKVLFGIYAFTI